jgi:hypothetical protein
VRLGIHHDGITHNIPPFEAEIRRRTWWQVFFLDGQASRLAGAVFPMWMSKFDTELPLNVSDSDMSPTMKETPPEREGATEMLLCRLRTEIAGTFREAGVLDSEGIWHLAASPENIPAKDKAIDELEARLQKNYVQYCDPSIPLHLLCLYMAKSAISTMRLLAHHPRQYPDKGASMPQREKDMLWAESLKELENFAACHMDQTLQGFLWHTYVHSYVQFHLDALIYVLSELRNRTSGDLVERAWRQIELAYEHRPEMLTEHKDSLYFAMGSLCLKAWAKYEEAGGRYDGTQLMPVPRYISKLRTQRKIPEPPTPPPQPTPQQPTPESLNKQDESTQMPQYANYIPGYNTYNTTNDPWDRNRNMAMTEITPVDWEYWRTLMDGELPTYAGDQGMALDPSQGWIG